MREEDKGESNEGRDCHDPPKVTAPKRAAYVLPRLKHIFGKALKSVQPGFSFPFLSPLSLPSRFDVSLPYPTDVLHDVAGAEGVGVGERRGCDCGEIADNRRNDGGI